jgi:Ala-tRNA(Pro) deacylase
MNDHKKFFALLSELGIPSDTIEHQTVYTATDLLENEDDLEFPVKNILVRDKDRHYYLISMHLKTPSVDLKELVQRSGARGRFTFATPEELAETLGVTPGSVSPYAIINDTAHAVSLVLDGRLKSATTISGHPLINTMTTTLTVKDFLKLCAHTGHEVLWCEMPVK